MRFRLLQSGKFRFAIDENHVKAVVAWTEPTPLPFAPNGLLGVVCIEGQMFSVLDLVILSKPEVTDACLRNSILTLRGDEQLALAATATEEVEVNQTQIKSVETEVPDLIGGVIEHEGTSWQMINVNQLFNVLIRGRERRRRRFSIP